MQLADIVSDNQVKADDSAGLLKNKGGGYMGCFDCFVPKRRLIPAPAAPKPEPTTAGNRTEANAAINSQLNKGEYHNNGDNQTNNNVDWWKIGNMEKNTIVFPDNHRYNTVLFIEGPAGNLRDQLDRVVNRVKSTAPTPCEPDPNLCQIEYLPDPNSRGGPEPLRRYPPVFRFIADSTANHAFARPAGRPAPAPANPKPLPLPGPVAANYRPAPAKFRKHLFVLDAPLTLTFDTLFREFRFLTISDDTLLAMISGYNGTSFNLNFDKIDHWRFRDLITRINSVVSTEVIRLRNNPVRVKNLRYSYYQFLRQLSAALENLRVSIDHFLLVTDLPLFDRPIRTSKIRLQDSPPEVKTYLKGRESAGKQTVTVHELPNGDAIYMTNYGKNESEKNIGEGADKRVRHVVVERGGKFFPMVNLKLGKSFTKHSVGYSSTVADILNAYREFYLGNQVNQKPLFQSAVMYDHTVNAAGQGIPGIRVGFLAKKMSDGYTFLRGKKQSERMQFYRKVLAMLTDAHRRGIVVNDFKWVNILVDSNENPLFSDPGRMRIHDDRSDFPWGTYDPPEKQFRNNKWGTFSIEIEQKADVWAFAISVLEMELENTHPSLVARLRVRPNYYKYIPCVLQYIGQTNPELNTLLTKALSSDYTNRSTMAEMLTMMDQILSDGHGGGNGGVSRKRTILC